MRNKQRKVRFIKMCDYNVIQNVYETGRINVLRYRDVISFNYRGARSPYDDCEAIKILSPFSVLTI